MQVLSERVPSFCYSQSQMSPTLLVRLSEDMHAVFDRLAALRALLPRNDISSMIGLRSPPPHSQTAGGFSTAVQDAREE